MMYLASDTPIQPLSIPGWCQVTPMDEIPQWATTQLSLSHVATVTVDGCSCGFLFDDPADEPAAKSREVLAGFLRRSIDRGAEIELLASWVCEEDRPAERDRDLVPEDLLTAEPSFSECPGGTPLYFRVVTSRV